jgi:hypothetical protein
MEKGFNGGSISKGPPDQYSITISSLQTVPDTRLHKNISGPKREQTGIDKVKWAYMKVALLFALSILITWVPASANRVYGLIYPDQPSYAANVASALVLPLQGFWNTIIYFTTSLTICRAILERLRNGKQQFISFERRPQEFVRLGNWRGRTDKGSDGESTVELSNNGLSRE